jgi:hypothetical protein
LGGAKSRGNQQTGKCEMSLLQVDSGSRFS